MMAKETDIHENAKKAIIESQDMDTVITGTCTGEPCRQLKNKLSDRMLKLEAEYSYQVAAEKLKEIAISSLRAADIEGDIEENGAVMVGQVTALINQKKPTLNIINETLEGCKESIKRMNEFIFNN
ncbi:nitronate monooxygenase [Acetobacterium sp. KB-1]|jgi:enoyl-[acyl-carrier protein] reductase II|nr:nitronate monooxygenase [Acetobacterium sp. KB-1]